MGRGQRIDLTRHRTLVVPIYEHNPPRLRVGMTVSPSPIPHIVHSRVKTPEFASKGPPSAIGIAPFSSPAPTMRARRRAAQILATPSSTCRLTTSSTSTTDPTVGRGTTM